MPTALAAALLLFVSSNAAPTLADAARSLRADPAAFSAADRDGDGRIDDRELEAARRALVRGEGDAAQAPSLLRIGGRDTNGDGALTPDELYPEL